MSNIHRTEVGSVTEGLPRRRYELISKIGVPHGTFPSAELAALRALTLWPDQEQDPDRTGRGWDIQIAEAK